MYHLPLLQLAFHSSELRIKPQSFYLQLLYKIGKVNMFSDLKYAKCIHCISFKLDALLNLIPADGNWLAVNILRGSRTVFSAVFIILTPDTLLINSKQLAEIHQGKVFKIIWRVYYNSSFPNVNSK